MLKFKSRILLKFKLNNKQAQVHNQTLLKKNNLIMGVKSMKSLKISTQKSHKNRMLSM